jgi:peptidoglycan/LPS O-acetylase OafA/YrhL
VVALLLLVPNHPVAEFFGLGIAFALAMLWVQRPAARTLSVHTLERPVLAVLANAGKLSFGLYMFHPFVRHWCLTALERPGWGAGRYAGVLMLAMWIPATWAIAWASYRYLEEPLLEWARRRVSAMLASEPQAPVIAVAEAAKR